MRGAARSPISIKPIGLLNQWDQRVRDPLWVWAARHSAASCFQDTGLPPRPAWRRRLQASLFLLKSKVKKGGRMGVWDIRPPIFSKNGGGRGPHRVNFLVSCSMGLGRAQSLPQGISEFWRRRSIFIKISISPRPKHPQLLFAIVFSNQKKYRQMYALPHHTNSERLPVRAMTMAQ